MTKKILLIISIIALNILAFIGVIYHGDFIDWIYYPIVILLLCYLFYKYYYEFPALFIFFNLLVIIKYFDSLNKVEGYPYPDGALTDFYIGLAYVLINIIFIVILNKVRRLKIIILTTVIIAIIIFYATLVWIYLLECIITPIAMMLLIKNKTLAENKKIVIPIMSIMSSLYIIYLVRDSGVSYSLFSFIIPIIILIFIAALIKDRTLAENKRIMMPISAIVVIIVILYSNFTNSLLPVLTEIAIFSIFYYAYTPFVLSLSFLVGLIGLDTRFMEDKRMKITLTVIFSILCYTPIISAPSSFIRQIVGAQLIQDGEREVYCVTKITKEFICTIGEIEPSSIKEDCYLRIGCVYKFSDIDQKYVYKNLFLLDCSGGDSSGNMDPQVLNMKDYYVNINHFFFKLFKNFRAIK